MFIELWKRTAVTSVWDAVWAVGRRWKSRYPRGEKMIKRNKLEEKTKWLEFVSLTTKK